MRLGQLTLAAILGLAVAAPMAAQDTEMADVGIGAPRTTLAYMVARPQVVLSLMGHNGQRLVWMPQPEGTEEGKTEGDNPMPPGEDDLMQSAAATFLPAFEKSTRLDIVLVDVSASGPRMYLDFTLPADMKIDMVPEWLSKLDAESEEITISDATFHGIAVKRYRMGGDFPEMFAFHHKGHFYVCAFDSVIEGLCNGFTNGSRDGESLAESSAFKSWYGNRKGTALDIWLNAREFRRWIDRGEGALPPSAKAVYDELDSMLQLRTWSQFTIGIDYDTRYEKVTLDVDIVSRKEIPLFEKTQFQSKSFGTIGKYVPPASLAITGFQFGDVNALVERMTEDFDRLGHLIMKAEEDMRPKYEPREWPEEKKEDGPKGETEPLPPEPDGGPMKTPQEPGWEGPDGPMPPSREASKTPFSDMMKQLREQLAEFGTTPEEVLGSFDGSFLMGVRGQEVSPWGGLDMFPESQMFMILGVKDAAKLTGVLNKAAAKFKEMAAEHGGEPEITAVKVGELQGYVSSMGGQCMVVTKDALLVAMGGGYEDPNGTLQTMLAASKGGDAPESDLAGRLARSTATMVLGFDIYRKIVEEEDQNVAGSKKLSTDARPNFSPSVKGKLNPNLRVTAALNMDAKSLNFKLVFTGVKVDKLIELGQGTDNRSEINRFYYTDSQLNGLYGQLTSKYVNAGEALPKTLEEAVKAGKIRRAFLQSPNDPRFTGADKVQWFPGEGLDMPENPEWPTPGLDVIKANEAKDFISYTLVPNADLTKYDASYIVLYETNANTFGGRRVLYSNGSTGWLHADVWEQALVLIKEGKPVPSPWDSIKDMDGGDMPDTDGPEDGGK